MQIKVISSREEIFILNPNERIVHLAFRPSNKDLFALIEACPKIEAIHYPNIAGARSQNLLKRSLRFKKLS